MEDRFVKRSELKGIVGVSPVTAWRLEKEGIFPKRRRLSAGRVGWLHSELMEWLRSREAAA